MTKKTQNEGQENSTDSSAIENARERLVQEVEQEASITPEVNDKNLQPTKKSEETFIDFVAEKSRELPKDPKKKKLKKKKKEKKKQKGIIRTYYTDIAETIRNKKLSLARIAVVEETAREEKQLEEKTPQTKTKSSKHNLTLSVISIFLLIGASAIVVFIFLEFKSDTSAPLSIQQSLMRANKTVSINTTDNTRETLLATLDEIANSAGENFNDIVNITLVKNPNNTPISAGELFDILDVDSDAALLRSIKSPFMFGLHVIDRPYFFLILKASFFENAFAGMLRWEEHIARELPFLVRAIESTQAPQTQTATTSTTTAITLIPETANTFEDVVIRNKDVRARQGTDGEYDMLYTFTDPETLIITSSTDTLQAVIKRLTISRFER